MNSRPMIRNDDGSLTPAEPLDWQGPENQVDFEVYNGGAHGWMAEAYNRAEHLGTITARTRLGIWFSARVNFGFRRPMTFLWDPS